MIGALDCRVMDDVADVHGEAELKHPHRQGRQQRADEDELDGARPGVVAKVRGDPGTRTGDETGQPGQGHAHAVRVRRRG